MEKGKRHIAHFLHIILAIAIFTSTISPACAFISGKETIEICTAFGVKKIEIDSQNSDDTSQNTKHMMQDCMFCFAQSHQTDFSTYQKSDTPHLLLTTLIFSTSAEQIESADLLHAYGARAPPILV